MNISTTEQSTFSEKEKISFTKLFHDVINNKFTIKEDTIEFFDKEKEYICLMEKEKKYISLYIYTMENNELIGLLRDESILDIYSKYIKFSPNPFEQSLDDYEIDIDDNLEFEDLD